MLLCCISCFLLINLRFIRGCTRTISTNLCFFLVYQLNIFPFNFCFVNYNVVYKSKGETKDIELGTQGSFVPHGHQDVLAAAIGRLEHPGRVRAAGVGVTIKQYFGSTPRASRSSSSLPPDKLQQLTQQIGDQLEESITEKVTRQMQSQGLAVPPDPLVGPSDPRVSTKGSCVDPSGNDPETGDSDRCGLYIEADPARLVAMGRVYEGSTVIHNTPLLPGQVKVSVEEVTNADAPVPVPTDEVRWDATVFGVFNPDFPFYIKHEDLSEIAHGGQCLSILVHLTETCMRVGNSDIYGFLEPQSIQRFGQSQFESESYIKSWMHSSQSDVYLGAYLNGSNNYLKGIINSALKGLGDAPQPKSKASARWIVVKYFNNPRPLEPEILKALRIQWAQFYLRSSNEKMMDKRKFLGKNDEETRSYFTWNLEMERVLADVLRDQRNLGNKGDGGWKRSALNVAAAMLSTSFNVNVSSDNVKNRIKLWRSWYGIVSDILGQSGFDWDGTKHMITVENENAWNEYCTSHISAKPFRFEVIQNWDDRVDLCAKDRATGHGAETAMDADEAMSREINEVEFMGLGATAIDLEEPNSNKKGKRQGSTSSRTHPHKRKMREKEGIAASLDKMTNSFNRTNGW
ncbi:hypothetical protein HKD37_13G036536 [Glycine soja]